MRSAVIEGRVEGLGATSDHLGREVEVLGAVGLPTPGVLVPVLMHEGPSIHRDDALRGRRAAAEGGVQANGVAVDAPLLDGDGGLADRTEDLAVELFIPEPRIEALDMDVLPR